MKERIKEVSEYRLGICGKCEFQSTNRKNYKTVRLDVHCTKCGCTLSAKTACLSCSCPIKLWNDVVSQDEEDGIKSEIDG
jgi:hypothetical protein